jgi:hypothetical protein
VTERTTTTQPGQGTEQVFTALNRLAALGTQQMLTALQSSQPLIDAYIGMLRSIAVLPMTTMPALQSAASSMTAAMPAVASSASAMLPSVSSLLPTTTCCEIPETACPPRCVCVIAWQAARGEDAKATITLTNTAKKAQAYSIESTTFQGPSGDTGVTPTVAPANVNLNPNQSATIEVTLNVTDKFETNNSYAAEVTITGQYEQCVQLHLTVTPSRRHHCDVKQGDIPTHIRAHRWYDHFQCEEPCFEPATPRRTDQTDHPGETHHR